ncbi:MAG: hypothetical protein SFU85_12645 [Candidatus Methylacidiphilales bacterium]|nr:hypothetical protein [Candidatus Methylacidiphilales bacterium]
MSTKNHSSQPPLQTVLLFAAGTLLAAAGASLVVRLLNEKNLEHLARLAAGESDYEHEHPKRQS